MHKNEATTILCVRYYCFLIKSKIGKYFWGQVNIIKLLILYNNLIVYNIN